MAAIPAAVPGIHVCNLVYGGKTPLLARETLAEMGYAGVIYANAALQASLLAMTNVLGHLNKAGSLAGVESALVSFEQRQKTVNHQRFRDLEKRFAAP
jgi:2-methylisocitrate lyase-like PEP mutase family enzyme